MQGEFRMITDLAAVTPKELLFNYDELKTFLSEALQEYKTLVVTEDGISEAKAKRAKINKLADNINDYRISVSKQLLKQYNDDFKPKCDELVGMCKEASGNIDVQVKAFEQREADAKIARLREVYDASDGLTEKEFCPWEAVYNAKWRNKGYSEDDAKGEIANALLKTCEDIETIRALDETDRPYLLDFYKSCRDIGQVIRKSNELKLRRMEEQRRASEAEARQREENARAAKEIISAARKPAEDAAVGVDLAQGKDMTVSTPIRVLSIRVWGTETMFADLKAYMKSIGMKYGPVE